MPISDLIETFLAWNSRHRSTATVAFYRARLNKVAGLSVQTGQGLSESDPLVRTWVSQIMDLLLLAPDIQEELLFLPRTLAGRDAIILRDLLPIASTMEWAKQRAMWRQVIA